MDKQTEMLECILTDRELLSYGSQLSTKNKEVVNLDAQKKAVNSEYTAKIDLAKAEIDTLSTKVSTGREFRSVEIRVDFNMPIPGKRTITRLDTGELVREKDMTSAEIQDLFIDAESKKTEEDLEEEPQQTENMKGGKKK